MAWAYTLSLAGVVFALLGAVASPAVHSACSPRRNLGRPIRCALLSAATAGHAGVQPEMGCLPRFATPADKGRAHLVDLAGIEPASETHPRRFIQP